MINFMRLNDAQMNNLCLKHQGIIESVFFGDKFVTIVCKKGSNWSSVVADLKKHDSYGDGFSVEPDIIDGSVFIECIYKD